jgi:very-short-patch-repair endonuclease
MLPYQHALKPLSRALRRNATPAEQLLWARLRRKQVLGLQFYRQKPIAGFIVDFYCAAAKLVIELDGAQHLEPDAQDYDRQRTQVLEALGLQVVRFGNHQVIAEMDGVMAVIESLVKTSIDEK